MLFGVFRIGHKVLCGVLNRPQSTLWCLELRHKVLCGVEICEARIKHHKVLYGVLNRPQSALWYFRAKL